jgi:CBS domain-containing protein
MKVQDIMTRNIHCCGLDTNLAAAAELMWNYDCGALPVIDQGKLTGIITDRDICMALGTEDRRPSETLVRNAASRHIETCHPNDSMEYAMRVMRRAQVHRLPVVEDGGQVIGMLTINDIVKAAQPHNGQFDYSAVVDTLKGIGEHHVENHLDLSKTPYPPIVVAVA